MQDPLDPDAVEVLLELMEGIALTPESLEACIKSGAISAILAMFHRKEYLHSERSPSQNVCASLGESLRSLVECNELLPFTVEGG